MFGLKQITLHNSYYNALTVAISANGHTNCSGTNAAGKTSMLQLVPFFFGCPPSRFNPKNKDKLPFVDFVLPTHSSLIIYDYHRRDGDCCAVIYRSPSNTVAYRFIHAHSSKTFFSENVQVLLGKGAAATEVFSEISAQGFEVSTQLLTISEYAAIIQGDVATLRRLGSKGRVRDAQRYGLATTSQPMRFIGEMTFTLLKRARMYEELKRMMANTLFDYSAPDIPKHRNNERLSRDLKGLREFEQHKDSIRRCVKLHHERLHLRLAVARYARGVQRAKQVMQAEQSESESKRAALLYDQERLDAEYEENQSLLIANKIQAEQKLKALKQMLQSAEDDQDQWLNDNISEKQSDYEKLSDFREELEIAEEHYQLLLSENRQISDQRDSKLNGIQKRVNEREAAFIADVKEKNEAKESIDGECRRKLQSLLEQENKEIESCREEANSERERQLPEMGRLQHAIELGGLGELERIAEASAEDKLNQHEQNIELLHQTLEQHNEEESRAKIQFEQALQKLEGSRRKLETIKGQIEELETILYPAKDSLLATLRAELPTWQEHIGKVINPSLLRSTKLSPVVTQGENFYGLDLDLDKLQSCEYAEEVAVLEEKNERAKTEKQLLEDEIKQQEVHVHACKRDWEQAQQQHGQTRNDYKLAQSARIAAREHLQRLRITHKNSVSERKAAMQSQLALLEKRLKDERNKYDEHLEQLRGRYKSQREVIVNDGLTAKSEVDVKIQQLSENFQQLQQRAQKEVAEVEAAYAGQSADQGIDEATLRAAKSRSESTRDRYKQVQAYGDDIQKYDHFVRNIWSKVDGQRQESIAVQQELDGLKQALQALQTEFEVQKSKLKQQLKLLDQQLREKKEKLFEASELLKQVGAQAEGEVEQGELTSLCCELAALLPREQELRHSLLKSVADALNAVQSNPESKIYEAWKLLSDQRLAHSPYEEFTEEYRLNLPVDLETLLDQNVPQIRDGVIQLIKSVGGAFEEFYRTLRQLETDVARVSRELKKKVNTNQRIAALQDIRLELSSKIASAVDGWEDLQGFIVQWEDWSGGFSQKLPPESLELALARVINQFQASNIKMDIGSLFDLEIHMVESGRPTCINSNAAFDDASSNGLSYLALIVIFVGLSRYLCPDEKVTLTWPVDELATLDPKNVAALFTMLKNNNIEVFSAFPSTDYNLLQHFVNRYTLDRKSGARQFLDSPVDSTQVDKLLAQLGTLP